MVIEMMNKYLIYLCLLCLSILLSGCSKQSENVNTLPMVQDDQRAIRPVAKKPRSNARDSLVIGNSEYTFAGFLRNPGNDAKAISETLRELNFDVTTLIDADQQKMETAIREFGNQLKENNGVGLFFYAGHGMQFDDENYLLPVDINPSTQEDVRYDAVPLGKLLAQMNAAGNGMNMVILDACRNNPFARSFRSTNRGLAQVIAPTGSFISYATAPGNVAADGDGSNGLYTEKLLEHMKTPGLKLEEVFKRVRADVQRDSNNRQVPWDSSSITGDFYFIPVFDPPPDSNKIKLTDLQQKVDALQQAKIEEQRIRIQWQNWQQTMQQDYERVLVFEKQNVGNEVKIESWQRFLSNWAEDNPYSNQDADLRSGAQSKVSYWKNAPRNNETQPSLGQQTRYMSLTDYYQDLFSSASSWRVIGNSREDLVYTGDLKNGLPDGHGALTSPEGFRYVGNWKDGDFSGLGTFTWSNSAEYVGEWENGLANGQGTLTYPDGQKQSGLWKDGVFIEGSEKIYSELEENLGGTTGKKRLFEKRECNSCDLRGEDLSGVTMHQVDLSRADLTEANLRGANLSSSSMGGSNFYRANLQKSILPLTQLKLAIFREADLQDANLQKANLEEADFQNAVLTNANLEGAVLHKANLRYADLRNANLKNADFKNAILTGANLSGADDGIIFFNEANFSEAKFCKTKMPDGSINNRDC